jgi:hypothetical protein
MPRLLALITLLLAVAAPAAAQTHGGSEAGGGAVAPTGGHVATVTDGRITVSAKANTVLGRTIYFRGHVPTSDAGRTITIERFDAKKTVWVPEAATVVRSDGAFVARWRTDHIGRFRLRATIDDGSTARAAQASPELELTIYKPAKATWYGPGFYGRTTACGQTMSRYLVGVAHKTLPCGSNVAVMYKGRVMTVPVVDRGPYANGASWDLTYAAARALGFRYTDVIGAVRLREPAPAR